MACWGARAPAGRLACLPCSIISCSDESYDSLRCRGRTGPRSSIKEFELGCSALWHRPPGALRHARQGRDRSTRPTDRPTTSRDQPLLLLGKFMVCSSLNSADFVRHFFEARFALTGPKLSYLQLSHVKYEKISTLKTRSLLRTEACRRHAERGK